MAIFCGVVDASWLLVYMVGSLVRLPMSRNESVRGNEADDSGFALAEQARSRGLC